MFITFTLIPKSHDSTNGNFDIKVSNQIRVLEGNHIKLKSAVIETSNVYFISEENELYFHNESSKVTKCIGHYYEIKATYQQFLILTSKKNRKQIVVIDSNSSNILFTHDTQIPITSATVIRNSSLAIGD